MASPPESRPQRPRTSSVLSFGNRSHKSSGSVGKVDLTESPKDKMSRRITGKADPRVAINELQPAARQLEASTMAPLRSMQHRDSFGQAIADPDRSNPTRPRMERPLETIKSFEAAIDSTNSRRYSTQPDMQSRRSSYYQGYGGPPRTPVSAGGYFDRQPSSRPDSMYGDNMNDRGYPGGDRGYQQNDRAMGPPTDRGFQNGGYHGNYQPRRYPPRNQSDPMMHGSPHAYGSNGPAPMTPAGPAPPGGQWTHPALAQPSHDTATTATSASYGTEQGTNSTEASLHNSSYGELPNQQYNKPLPPPHDAYANGYSHGHHGATEDEYGQPLSSLQRSRGFPQQADMATPPPPPAHGRGTVNGANTLRKQAPSNYQPGLQSNGFSGETSAPARPANEKRKSWLKRRFSKNN